MRYVCYIHAYRDDFLAYSSYSFIYLFIHLLLRSHDSAVKMKGVLYTYIHTIIHSFIYSFIDKQIARVHPGPLACLLVCKT